MPRVICIREVIVLEGRGYYFDRLRIIATVAVVLIHVCAPELFRFGIASPAWDVCNAFDSFSRFAVPVFIMISGAIFLNPQRKTDIKTLYSKNLLRIITAFLVWSVVYAVHGYGGSAAEFLKNIFLGHFHMYFLFIIGTLYLAVPVYRKICEDEKVMGYFLVLCIVFTFLLPAVAKLKFMSVVSDVLDKAKFNLVTGYSAYFVGGYYLSRAELSKRRRWVIYILGIFAFLATALFTRSASLQSGILFEEYYSYFSGNVLVQAAAVFVFGKYRLNFEPKTKRRARRLLTASKLTFGVYLSHVLVLDVLRYSCRLNRLTSIPLYLLSELLFTLLISGIISYVLNKIPVLKKYIV